MWRAARSGFQAGLKRSGVHDFRAGVRVRFADGEKDYHTAVALAGGEDWTRFSVEVTTPEVDTEYFNPRLTHSSDPGAVEIYVTGLRCEDVTETKTIRGEISEIRLADVDVDGVVATMQDTAIAEFGSFQSFVQATSTAVASDDLLASTFVLKQRAGAAAGTIEAVAFNDPNGVPASHLSPCIRSG